MRNLIPVFSALFIFACSGPETPPPPEPIAEISPLISAEDDTLRIGVNKEFWIDFMIENGKNVYAVAARLKYDSLAVKTLKASTGKIVYESGGYLGEGGDLTLALLDSRQGNLMVAYSKQGTQPGTNGGGLLWRVKFKAIKSGTTQLIFDSTKSAILSPNFIDNIQERMPSRFVDGVLDVSMSGDNNVAVIRLRVTE